MRVVLPLPVGPMTATVCPGWTEKVNLTFASGDLPDAFIREQIRNSYLLVVRRSVTPRSLREEILRHVEEHGLPE